MNNINHKIRNQSINSNNSKIKIYQRIKIYYYSKRKNKYKTYKKRMKLYNRMVIAHKIKNSNGKMSNQIYKNNYKIKFNN